MTIKTVFMGSPEFALPTLHALAGQSAALAGQGESAPRPNQVTVVGVVTQPDRPAGRGKVLTPPPIKTLALKLGLPVIQPNRLRDPEALAQLQAWAPDLIVVAAFGQILRPSVLDLPRFGCVNVHASLLPRGRGAAPIQAAILQGDSETGITIMRMDPGIDTGPLLSQRALPILPDDTAGSLTTRLAALGADLLLETLPGYLSGTLLPQPQPEAGATYAPMLKKEDGQLNFAQPAEALARKVRAFNPWPGAFTQWQGQILKIQRAHAVPLTLEFVAAGRGAYGPRRTTIYQGLPAIVTVDGLLVLDELQPAGKKPMPGKVFLQGARAWGSAPELMWVF